MRRIPKPSQPEQRGAALLLGMLVLAMAVLAGLFWNLSRINYRAGHDKATAAALARAKDALIAAAASGDLSRNRPGELPCPDLDDDGDADTPCSTTGQRLGRLPWKTLGLPDLRDGSGERLWYALSASYRKNSGASINSDTPGTITIRDTQGTAIFDAAAGTGAVAVLIAPGSPVTRPTSASNGAPYVQARSGAGINAAINYLDLANGEDNADFVDYASNGFGSGPVRDAGGNVVSNDQVLAIGRDELMAAAERRVAREVKACIELHADSSINTAHRFPWPAPLSVTDYKGKAGSYFGAVPITQPGINPQAVAQQTLSDLSNARTAVTSAGTATDQRDAVRSLADLTDSAKQFYYWLYLAVKDASFSNLAQKASNTSATAITLEGLSKTAKKSITKSAADLQANIDALQLAITDTGIDVFPPELASKSKDFQEKLNAAVKTPPSQSRFSDLQAAADAITGLLALVSTPNPAIGTSLSAALSASQQAGANLANAAKNPSDPAAAGAALGSGNELVAALISVQTAISSYRVNIGAAVIDGYTARVNAVAAQLNANPSVELAALLAASEKDLKTVIDGLSTGAPAIVSSRNSASTALSTAIGIAGASSPNYAQTLTAAADAVAAIATLSSAVRNNGDNLSQTSLAAAAGVFGTARAAFESNSTPTNAEALQNASRPIKDWADVFATQASNIAFLAFESTSNSSPSAFVAARDASASINDDSGSLAALQAYIANPGDSALQAKAGTRLATTINRLDTLIASTDKLLGTLSSSTGSAFPLTWLSPAGRCDFLNSGVSGSWWNDNGWSTYVFYQIGDILGTAPGSLKVNGNGAYRIVAVAAGRPLSGQHRNTRTAASHFEDINADSTRDGDAVNPIRDFVDRVFSTTFNDRLAY